MKKIFLSAAVSLSVLALCVSCMAASLDEEKVPLRNILENAGMTVYWNVHNTVTADNNGVYVLLKQAAYYNG